jgi:hypothetical protein
MNGWFLCNLVVVRGTRQDREVPRTGKEPISFYSLEDCPAQVGSIYRFITYLSLRLTVKR